MIRSLITLYHRLRGRQLCNICSRPHQRLRFVGIDRTGHGIWVCTTCQKIRLIISEIRSSA